MTNNLHKRVGRVAVATTSLALLAGCTLGMWTLFPSADVQLPWAADLDRTDQYLLVSDLHASQVKVLTKQGSLRASIPYSTLPGGSYVEKITSVAEHDHQWWALTQAGGLIRFVYDPVSQGLVAGPSGANWLGAHAWKICDIASGRNGDLFVAYIDASGRSPRVDVRRLSPFGPTLTRTVNPSSGPVCGQLAFDAVHRQVVYYDPTQPHFQRITEDLGALAGTTPMPPNSNSAVHDFAAIGSYLMVAHPKVVNPTKAYLDIIDANGAQTDSMLFQSLWEVVLEGPANNQAALFVFGSQSNAKMHRFQLSN